MAFIGNETCDHLHELNQNLVCDFVLNATDCSFEDGFIQYIQLIYCAGSSAGLYGGLVLMFLWCLVLLLLLATVADEFFGPSLVVIAKLLHFSDNLAGVTLLALGNGAADIFSAIAAARTTKEGDAGLMYGSLLGAGILVTTVTTACVALVKPFRTQRRPIVKDILFYIAAVIWNLTIMLKGYIHLGEALGFIALYIFYVSLTVASRTIRSRMLKQEAAEEKGKEKGETTPKFPRKAKISRLPGAPEIQMTHFRRFDPEEDQNRDEGHHNRAFVSEAPHLKTIAEVDTPDVAVQTRLTVPQQPRIRVTSDASGRYDGSMQHMGLQRVEGVAVRRSRPAADRHDSGKSSMKRVSAYRGLNKKFSMRQQRLGVPVHHHHGPRPSYLTQWVMAYRQEDDEEMIPTPDPRDLQRQRSRSHMEIQRDLNRANFPRARSATTGAAPAKGVRLSTVNNPRIQFQKDKFHDISLDDDLPAQRRSVEVDPVPEVAEVDTMYDEADQVVADGVEEEEEEESYVVPGFFSHFLVTINPIDPDVWQDLTFFWKIFEVLRCPIRFLLTLIIPLVDFDHPTQGWCKLLKMLQCLITPIMWLLAIQAIDVKIGSVFPVWALVLIIGVVLAILVYLTSNIQSPPKYHFIFAFVGFATSIVCIYSVTNEVVNILPTFGVVFKISRAVLALTFLAWANSVGDIMSNTILAKNNFPRIAISACFGGPLFNLLLGIGIPFSMLTASGDFTFKINATMVQLILVIFLLLTLISHLVLLTVFRFNVKRYYGVYFIFVYITFVTVAILSELKIIPSFDLKL